MSLKHKVLLLGCLIVLAVASVVWVKPAVYLDLHSARSTYSTAPDGCKALYLLLEELKLPVTRLRFPLTRLDVRQGALVVIEPHQVALRKREVPRLKQWVEKGNILILFSGGPQPKPALDLESAAQRKKSQGQADNRLTRTLGLSLKSFSDESRKVVEVASPVLYGISKISVSGKTRWLEPSKQWKKILEDDAGPIIVAQRLGKGEIVAVSDASMASNRDVSLEQNVRVLPALVLEKGRPKAILFDEYHHGYMTAESLWTYVGGSGFALLLFQVGVGSLLFFYSRRASYAGRFRTLSRPTGRSSLEYVESMANVFDTCKAGSVALEAVLSRFFGRLSRAAGVPRKRLEANAREKSSVYAPGGADLGPLINQCREAVKGSKDSATAVELAKRLSEASRRLRPTRDVRSSADKT